MTISPGLSGSISHVGTGVMSGNLLYINTFAPQFILLSWIDTPFVVTGDIISEITGDLSILVPEVYTLSLTAGDGMKLVTALYFPPAETGFSTNTIRYFVDTTMPSVSTTIT